MTLYTSPAQVTSFVRDVMEVHGSYAKTCIHIRGYKIAAGYRAVEIRSKTLPFQAYYFDADTGHYVVLTLRGSVLQLSVEEFDAAEKAAKRAAH